MKPKPPQREKTRMRGNSIFEKKFRSSFLNGKLAPRRAMQILSEMKQQDSPVQVVLFMRALLRQPLSNDMRLQLERDLASWEASAKAQIELGAKLLRAGKDPSLAGRPQRRP